MRHMAMILRGVVAVPLLLVAVGCTPDAPKTGANHPAGNAPSAGASTAPPTAAADDGRCDQIEGPGYPLTMRSAISGGPAVDIHDHFSLNLTVLLPSGGISTIRLSNTGVLRLNDGSSPGSRYKYFTVIGPGSVRLSAISGSGQHFAIALRVHC